MQEKPLPLYGSGGGFSPVDLVLLLLKKNRRRSIYTSGIHENTTSLANQLALFFSLLIRKILSIYCSEFK